MEEIHDSLYFLCIRIYIAQIPDDFVLRLIRWYYGLIVTVGFLIEGPSSATIKCVDNGDTSAEVSYEVDLPGEYAIHVTCDDEDIQGSPFMATVDVPSDIDVNRVGVFALIFLLRYWPTRTNIYSATIIFNLFTLYFSKVRVNQFCASFRKNWSYLESDFPQIGCILVLIMSLSNGLT